MSRLRTLSVIAGVFLMPFDTFSAEIIYPDAKRVEQVDTYHGTKVADPYRWLEDDVRKSSEVQEWVAAENKITNAYLRAIPECTGIQKRLTELWNYEKFTAPTKAGTRYFYRKNDGLQNQAVLYVMDALNSEPRVLLDPNTWSKDGTVALGGTSPSPDGKYLAYGVSEAGSDWESWKVVDVTSGKVLGDDLKWIKFSGASWTADGRGFFYSRYPEPKKGETFISLNKNQQLCYHRIGTLQSDDVLVYKRPISPNGASREP